MSYLYMKHFFYPADWFSLNSFDLLIKIWTYLCLEYQPEYLPNEDKKTYQVEPLQPDLTRGVVIPVAVPSCYEYPYAETVDKCHSLQRSFSDHHYDVPHLHSPYSQSRSTYSDSCTYK